MVYNKLLKIINELLENNEKITINKDESLINLGMDSIAFINLVVIIEDTFKIEIEEEELLMENFLTINSIENLLKRKGIGSDDNEYKME